ncbi:hypothetical protein [Vibrio alfacsensis]|uniref:hypothetical protein n=1 Tax=Vibrio alfacsensis TaxID=1074311 RepID=UPI0040697396
MTINTVIAEVAHNIVPRSKTCRKTYLYNIERSASKGKMRAYSSMPLVSLSP